jgi:hypothetical protein
MEVRREDYARERKQHVPRPFILERHGNRGVITDRGFLGYFTDIIYYSKDGLEYYIFVFHSKRSFFLDIWWKSERGQVRRRVDMSCRGKSGGES